MSQDQQEALEAPPGGRTVEFDAVLRRGAGPFAPVRTDRASEVPPLKWSILRYGFSKEDHDGKKETYG